MKFGHRRFIFESDGTIRRVAISKFYDFFNGRPPVALKEYAGQTIRSADVMVGTLNRRPARLLRVDYSLYKVDEDGFLDPQFRTELMQTAMESANPFAEKSDDILDRLRPGLAKLKLGEKFRWRPTPKEEAALKAIVFK